MKLFYSFLILLCLFAGSIQGANAQGDWMTDTNLISKVRAALGIGTTDSFTQDDMEDITTLNIVNASVADLTGLEYAKNLQRLSAWRNTFTDLNPLKDLTTLTHLKIGKGSVSDLSPLSGLTNLQALHVNNSDVTDVSPLKDMVNLTSLKLAGNNDLTNLGPIAHLKDNITDTNVTIPDPIEFTDITLFARTGGVGTVYAAVDGYTLRKTNAHIIFYGSENLSQVTTSEVELTNNTAGATIDSVTSSGTTGDYRPGWGPYITVTQDGSVTVGILGGVAESENGVTNEAASVTITVDLPSIYDMDQDGDVDNDDLVIVAQNIGKTGTDVTNDRADVDNDDDIDIDDFTAVYNNLSSADAPTFGVSQRSLETLDRKALSQALHHLRVESDGSLKYQRAIQLLESLLSIGRPKNTLLLANYPNPFNPETWIPYQLANASKVQISIYDVRGHLVRLLELGHQPEGYYTNRIRAAYWDGRNQVGERVSSGIYFYQLQTDQQSLVRKMVILK